jgi:hypothetical protein
MLLAELRSQRRHVKTTFDGLSDTQQWTPVLPSGWAPIAAMHHLALDVERWWFHAIVADDPTAWDYFAANPGGAWSVPDSTDVAALYDSECAASDEILSSIDLAAVPHGWPAFLGAPRTVGQIVLHVIGETANHAGQLDVVRELIDGRQHLVLN